MRPGDDLRLPRRQCSPRPGDAVAAPATPSTSELPEPVQRAINRERVDEEEWAYEDQRLRMVPVPGGCIMVSTLSSP